MKLTAAALASFALLLCSCGGDDTSAPAPPPSGGGSGGGGTGGSGGGGTGSQTGLIQDQTIVSGGLNRKFHLYLPSNPIGAPVVFLFHGFGGSNDDLVGLSGRPNPYEVWLTVAERENVVLVIPNGVDDGATKGWNDCRSDATGNSELDDVAFISALIDKVVADYQVDARRVYATGSSNGGHFSIRLGLELPDKIAAFGAIVAANSANSECRSSATPVSALFMNGTADPLLPYSGGQMRGERGLVFSAEETVLDWVTRNQANPNAVETQIPDNPNTTDNSSVQKLLYSFGSGGSQVALYRISGGGHNERSIQIAKQNTAGDQNRDIEMAEEVWMFFRDKSK